MRNNGLVSASTIYEAYETIFGIMVSKESLNSKNVHNAAVHSVSKYFNIPVEKVEEIVSKNC